MIKEEQRLTSLNKLNDAAFKAIFRSIEARGMVATFLSEVTGISKEDILNAYFVGGELTKNRIDEKGKSADIIIRLEDKLRIVIVEMNKHQNAKRVFRKNFEYYANLLTESTDIRKHNYHKVTLININNFNRHNVPVPIQYFQLRDQFGNIDTDVDLKIYDVILDNLIDSRYNNNIVYRKFGQFFKTDNLDELEKLVKGDEEYMSAFAKINTLSKDPDFIGYYDYEKDKEEELYFAREDGIEQGIENGKKMLIQNLHKNGMKVEEISKMTEISMESVRELLKS